MSNDMSAIIGFAKSAKRTNNIASINSKEVTDPLVPKIAASQQPILLAVLAVLAVLRLDHQVDALWRKRAKATALGY